MRSVKGAARWCRRLGVGLAVTSCVFALAACVAPPPAETPGLGAGTVPGKDAAELLHAARTVTGLYEVGEIRAFDFLQAGQVIGRSWSRYEGVTEVGLHRFSTRIELRPAQAEPLRSASEVLVDDAGNLVSGWERSVAAELRYSVADATLTMEAFTGLPIRERDELAFRPGTAHIAYMTTLHQEMMLATRELRAGKSQWGVVFLSTGRVHAWEGWVTREGDALQISTNLGETLDFRGERIQRVRVRDDDLEVVVVTAPTWPVWEVESPKVLTYARSPDARFDLRAIELVGRDDEPRLAGEVLVPRGLAGAETRPGVLFLGGGSPADRYGFAGPPAVDLGFHEITDALAQTGFVVLRYDERGVGESAAAEVSWQGQREDARRALRMLLVQPEVDPNRILVVGHGEGGWRAMQLAIERPREIVGVALLASPGRSYRKLFAAHPGLVESIESGAGLHPNVQANLRWYREILDVDPLAYVADLPCPLWIAQGGKDFEVHPTLEPESLAKSARRHGVAFERADFPELDHLFKAEPGQSTMTSYLVDRRVDSRFLARLINWADARTQAPSPARPRRKAGAAAGERRD